MYLSSTNKTFAQWQKKDTYCVQEKKCYTF